MGREMEMGMEDKMEDGEGLPSLRFYSVGGCWDRTQEFNYYCTDCTA